jgi:hypothetical protein
MIFSSLDLVVGLWVTLSLLLLGYVFYRFRKIYIKRVTELKEQFEQEQEKLFEQIQGQRQQIKQEQERRLQLNQEKRFEYYAGAKRGGTPKER